MGTFNKDHQWPTLTEAELRGELPNRGEWRSDKTIEITDQTREKIARFIDEQGPYIQEIPEPWLGGDGFNSWSTYKTK